MSTTKTLKTPKTIVSRLCHLHEKKRVVTIAYTYNRETKRLQYGGAVHRSTSKTDCWNKKNIDKPQNLV